MPLKFGIIGCGSIARGRHLPELAANKNAQWVAACDIIPQRAQEIATAYHAVPFTDYKIMLKNAELDAVVICGTNTTHAQHTIDCLNAGKHVLVEKPMATNRQDAKKMIATAKKTGKFLMIGHNQRLMPPHVKAREILQSKKLGRVLAFRTAFKHAGCETWAIDGKDTWFFKKEIGGLGVTSDLGIHKADLMRFLLGEEIAEVGGFIGTLDKKQNGKPITVEDNAYLILKTESGIIGSIIASWTNYGEPEANYTYIYCEQGVLMLATDPEYGLIVHYRNGNRERHSVGAIATNARQTTSGVSEAFIRSIMTGKKPEIDGKEGYQALNVILTAMEAAAQRKTLKIKH